MVQVLPLAWELPHARAMGKKKKIKIKKQHSWGGKSPVKVRDQNII